MPSPIRYWRNHWGDVVHKPGCVRIKPNAHGIRWREGTDAEYLEAIRTSRTAKWLHPCVICFADVLALPVCPKCGHWIEADSQRLTVGDKAMHQACAVEYLKSGPRVAKSLDKADLLDALGVPKSSIEMLRPVRYAGGCAQLKLETGDSWDCCNSCHEHDADERISTTFRGQRFAVCCLCPITVNVTTKEPDAEA